MSRFLIVEIKERFQNDPETGAQFYLGRIVPVGDREHAEALARDMVERDHKKVFTIVEEARLFTAGKPKVVIKERNSFGELVGVKD